MNKKISIRAYQWLILLLCVTFAFQTVRGAMMSVRQFKGDFNDSGDVFDRCPNRPILNNYSCQQNNNSSLSAELNQYDKEYDYDIDITVSETLALADEHHNGCNSVNNTTFVKDPKKEKSSDASISGQQKKYSDDLLDLLYDDDDFDLSKIINGNNNKANQQKNGGNDASNNNTKVVKDPEKSDDVLSKAKPKEVQKKNNIMKKVDKQQSNNQINKNKQQHNQELKKKEVRNIIIGIVKEVCDKQKEKEEDKKFMKEMEARFAKLQYKKTIEEQYEEAKLNLSKAKNDENIDFYNLEVKRLKQEIDSKNKEKEKAENAKKEIEALLKSQHLDLAGSKRFALTKIKQDIEKTLEEENTMSLKDILNEQNIAKIEKAKVTIEVEKKKQEIMNTKEVVQLAKKTTTEDYTYVVACIIIILWLYQKFFVKARPINQPYHLA